MNVASIGRTVLKPAQYVLDAFGANEEHAPKEISKDRDDILAERLLRLQRRQASRRQQKRVLIAMGLLVGIAGPLVARLFWRTIPLVSLKILVPVLYGAALLVMASAISPNEVEVEIRQTEDELDLLRSSEASLEQKAQKLFKLHQLELKKYYDQTLKQSKWIFLVGIFCLLLGFGAIGGSLWLVHQAGQNDKTIVAILGGIGGILSNFIAVVYLKMHSETIKSLTEFHNRLVLTHYLHFGNFLLAKIDNQNLRDKSLAQVAINLSTNQKHQPGSVTAHKPGNKHNLKPAKNKSRVAA
jgi:hypothetical protein